MKRKIENMNCKHNEIRAKLVIATFIIIFAVFWLLSIIITPSTILESERRYPATFPKFSVKTISSTEFMDKFENYIADNFPFRDSFRKLRTRIVFNIFLQSDKDGLYRDDYGAGEFNYLVPEAVEKLSAKIYSIASELEGINIYYAFIPDKSIYSNIKMPGFDSVMAEEYLMKNLRNKQAFINLTEALDANSFYKTDLHWNQTEVSEVVATLGTAMGFSADYDNYSLRYAGELAGVYVGQLLLPIGTDSLVYLNNPSLKATYLNSETMQMQEGPVYDLEKVSGLDGYNIFLSGIQPLIILENSEVSSGRELYLFRDSFSSSLAPLLASAYTKVYLLDLRYIDLRTIRGLIDFKPDSDALFLYSTQILNHSDMLLVW